MKAVSGTRMRFLDQRTIREGGIPGERLMRVAGALAAGAVMEYRAALLKSDIPAGNILILAGKGNNAGDAFVVASMLANTDCQIFLHCAVPESELSGDALTMFKALPEKIKAHISYDLTEDDLDLPYVLIVDGLLGTGFQGELREPIRSWCRLVNRSGHLVASLDIPSGLNADTGEADPDAIVADITFTMGQPKIGMLTQTGARLCGRLRVLDIGISARYVDELTDTVECTTERDAKKWLCREPFDIHKNSRGHLLVVGGSSLYCGAALLAGEAALRTGAGLVTCAIPASAPVYSNPPKALMIRRTPDSGSGFFNSGSCETIQSLLMKASAVVLGPGMGTEECALPVLSLVLGTELPVLLDADGLNLLAAHPDLAENIRAQLVLTPHPGEMNRLSEAFSIDGTLSRTEQALALARKLNAVVVLKGSRTVVAGPGGDAAVNLSGCPALATAGTGDLLSGMTGALLSGKRLAPYEAARCAAFLHGLTAEIASPAGSRGWIADDFPACIGTAIRKVTVNG